MADNNGESPPQGLNWAQTDREAAEDTESPSDAASGGDSHGVRGVFDQDAVSVPPPPVGIRISVPSTPTGGEAPGAPARPPAAGPAFSIPPKLTEESLFGTLEERTDRLVSPRDSVEVSARGVFSAGEEDAKDAGAVFDEAAGKPVPPPPSAKRTIVGVGLPPAVPQKDPPPIPPAAHDGRPSNARSNPDLVASEPPPAAEQPRSTGEEALAHRLFDGYSDVPDQPEDDSNMNNDFGVVGSVATGLPGRDKKGDAPSPLTPPIPLRRRPGWVVYFAGGSLLLAAVGAGFLRNEGLLELPFLPRASSHRTVPLAAPPLHRAVSVSPPAESATAEKPEPTQPGDSPATGDEKLPAPSESAVAADTEKPDKPAATKPAEPTPKLRPVEPAPAVEKKPAPTKIARVSIPEPAPVDTGSASVDELVRRGERRLRRGETEEAERLFRVALEKDPREHHAMEGLVKILLSSGRGTEAVGYAERMVKRRRKRASYRLLYGDALRMAGNHPAAVAQWKEALRLSPGDRTAKRRLGQ